MATLTIRHDHEDGTRLEGSRKGDGVYELLTPLGWTYRSWAGIHIRGSRDDWAWPSRLERHADALRAAGHTVTVEVDNTWRPAAVRWAEREERAAARADRLAERSGGAAARGDAHETAARRVLDHIPPGQPMLVDHYSYKADRNRRERAWASQDKAHDEWRYSADLASRAAGVVANEIAKHGPRAMTRRIEGLEEAVRKYRRQLAGSQPGEWADVVTLVVARAEEEITFLWGVLAERADSGEYIPWGPGHFRRGDEVKVSGMWLPVRRVNRKSVSVPWRVGVLAGVREEDMTTETVPYDKVFGRRRDGQQLDTPNGQPQPVGSRNTTSVEGTEGKDTSHAR